MFQEGSLKGDRSIAIYSRLKYLSWSLESQQGIKLVRQVYESLRQLPPFSEEFFMSYIEIEKCGDSVNFQRIVNAFEDATRHFGKESLSKQTKLFCSSTSIFNQFIFKRCLAILY